MREMETNIMGVVRRRKKGIPVIFMLGVEQVHIKLWQKLEDTFEEGVGDVTYAVSTPLWDYLYDLGVTLD